MTRIGRRRRSTGTAAPAGSLPAPGQLVSVQIADIARSWTTRVEQVVGAAVTLVAPTRTRGEAIVPEPGTGILVTWPTELGQMQASARLERAGQDVVTTWEVIVAEVSRRQRREAFRVATMLDVVLDVDGATVTAKTRDVSETGLGCAFVGTPAAPPPGTVVEVTFRLPDGPTVSGTAQVVRHRERPHEPGEPREFDVGLAFLDEDPDRNEDVRRFVMAEQLRQRRAIAGR